MKLLFLISCVFALSAKGSVCVSAGSGTWTSGSTWSCGSAPACGDSIVIQAGHTVSLTAQDYDPCGTKMVLIIKGTLRFTSGGKLEFDCLGRVYIFAGGQIVSANGATGNSNAVMQCNSTWWNAGAGTYNGPGCMPPFLTGCASVLPIELMSYNAALCDKGICISWKTASERNHAFFEVLRSENGVDYSSIEIIYDRGILYSGPRHYEVVDSEPFNATNYYRLRQVDRSGQTTLYPLIAVHPTTLNKFKFEIIPNPNSGRFTIRASGLSAEETVHLKILNVVGKVLSDQALHRQVNETEIFVDTDLPDGIYYVDFSTAIIHQVCRLIVRN